MDKLLFEDLSIGMVCKKSYSFTEQRVSAFSKLIGDNAPIHMDDQFAKLKGFDGKIVHGLFVQSVISGMLGETLPGPNSIINTLRAKLHGPVLIGKKVDYEVEITGITKAVSAISLIFFGCVDGQIVISGKALCSFPNIGSF